MKVSFRALISIMIMFTMAVSLSACGNKPTTVNESTKSIESAKSTEAPTAKKEVKTFTLATAVDKVNLGFEAVLKDIEDKSEALGFKFEVEKLAGGNPEVQALRARFATNNMPDFVFWNSVVSLRSDLGAEKMVIDIAGDWTKNFDEKTLKSEAYSADGAIVGLPMEAISPGVMFYNKKLFSDLNLSTPNTWVELLDVCEKIKTAGKIPVYYSGKDDWTTQIISLVGFSREFKARDMNELIGAINTNKAKYADMKLFGDSIAKTKELKDKGYVNTTYLSDTYDGAQKAIAEGQAGMYAMGAWFADEIRKKYPDKLNDIGAFAIPFDGNDIVPAWLPPALFVTTGCKDAELAKEAINYMGSVEVQNIYYKALPGIPLAKGITIDGLAPVQQEMYKMYSQEGRGGPQFQTMCRYGQGPFSAWVMDCLVGTKTVDEVLNAIDAEVSKTAKSKGDTNW